MNLLAMLVVLTLPWAAFEIARTDITVQRRAIGGLALVASLVILDQCRSRSALLAATITLGATAVEWPRWMTRGLVAALVVVAAAMLVEPDIPRKLVSAYVYKYTEDSRTGQRPTVLSTRQGVWSESYAAARRAGILGFGFGVSAGRSGRWEGEPDSAGFAREKGSSQLAIWEELGPIGLVEYLVLLAALGYAALYAWRPGRDRLIRSLTLGTLVASVLHTAFEAWFTAPGAPQTPMFWSVVGLGCGALGEREPQT